MVTQKIKILSEIEHIRTRPQMYIGDITSPQHLVTEVLDNSLDELINGFATRVDLNISKDSVVTIKDNGRGIPDYEMEYEGITNSSVFFLCTKLFSGTKFSLDDYKYLVGQHGVGLVVVNALSLWLEVHSKKYSYYFKDTKLIKVEPTRFPDLGTVVRFRPNGKLFKSLNFDEEAFKDRLRLVQSILSNLEIYYNDELCHSKTLDDFIKDKLSLSENTPLFKISISGKVDEKQDSDADVYFTYDMHGKAGLSPFLKGVVNLRQCEGTYLTSMSTAIVGGIYDNIKSNQKYILTKEDLKTRLRLFVNLKVTQPHFDSQAKVRYTGPDLDNILVKIQEESRKLFKSEKYIQNAVENINNYKILRRANQSSNNKNTRIKISVGSPLRDCVNHPGKTLYIVEGPSAGNTLIRARDPKIEAVFPMQGKIINAESNRLDKVTNNKFVNYLLEAIGVRKLGEPITNLRYQKIAVLADPDSDGLQISLLVMILIYKLIPSIIKEGQFEIVQPPLYGAVKGKEFISIYNVRQIEEFRNNGYQIFRFKGLGEMTQEQMKKIITQGKRYTVNWTSEGEKLIKQLFLSSESKRQLLDISDEEISKALFGLS